MQRQSNAVVADTSFEDKRDSLTAAFAFFNETSQQLSQSYELLERRVQQLTSDLDRVAEEKEQEHQKKQQIASQMRALLNFLPGGVIVLDSKGIVLEANPAAKQLLDCPLEGRLWREAINDCFAPKNDDGLEVSTHKGRRVSIATSSLGNDGQIILLTDQTETRKLQENLSRNERLSAMGKMVSALAHQIRTPLSAAMLYAGHLCNGELAQEKKDAFSKKLYGRLQHMEKQVRDMMLFVKSELPLNDVVSLADLELGLREASEVAISTTDSACLWNNANPNKQIKCHREALISAIMNLINNGIQACPVAPKLKIDISCVERNKKPIAQIRVIDYGEGISDSRLKDSAEIFVTTKDQGTGLGLSVVKSVAKAHGGTFELSSVLGKGTEALIEIPVLSDKPN